MDYHLTIRTGDIAGAGTDAPVFIQLVGDDGETERIELSPGGTGDKRFDRGRTDKFVIGTLDVGKVCWRMALMMYIEILLNTHKSCLFAYTTRNGQVAASLLSPS